MFSKKKLIMKVTEDKMPPIKVRCWLMAEQIQIAKKTYNVKRWSEGYVDINDQGNVEVFPNPQDRRTAIDLPALCQHLKQQGVNLPVLVRFNDILSHRASRLISAFENAIGIRDYQGQFTAVYPIKVNQQHSVVDTIVGHESGKVGLEAGSKPELLAVIGAGTKPITIVCNGYKDSEFMRLACIAHGMGHKVYVVIEKLSELNLLLTAANNTGVMPHIGVRIRLNSIGKGKWQNTGGEKGKFGLSATQVLQVIETLKEKEQLAHFKLVHFHIGSQIANIRDIHNAIRECARHYAELCQMGINIETIDVGGGLGVDYEGSGSRSSCSMNYTVDEYARNVVGPIADICQQQNLPQPNIITESGRAMTAHHAMLITNAIDIEKAPIPTSLAGFEQEQTTICQDLWHVAQGINEDNGVERYHDAIHLFTDAHQQYVVGALGLAQWAKIEQTYFYILSQVQQQLNPKARSHREVLDELNEKLADKLFLNFSLFQSLPDVWGIEQIFPVMPLSGLQLPLVNRAVIQDITCDSDGQINQYADGAGIESSLPFPEYQPVEQMLVGIFMVGAYQEILGDLHNLFGDTNSVHVQLNQDGYQVSDIHQGETVTDVLKHVQFEQTYLIDNYKQQLAASELSSTQQQSMLKELTEGLMGYTYFEDDN